MKNTEPKNRKSIAKKRADKTGNGEVNEKLIILESNTSAFLLIHHSIVR
jgi:hypothetical protein